TSCLRDSISPCVWRDTARSSISDRASLAMPTVRIAWCTRPPPSRVCAATKPPPRVPLVGRVVGLGDHHRDQERRPAGVRREPLLPVDHPLVTVELGAARELRR